MGYTASMITPAAARQLAEDYLTDMRPWAVVGELLEDTQDYFVKEELKPGQQWPLGPGALLIDKETGELRVEPWGVAHDQIDAMTPLPSPEQS